MAPGQYISIKRWFRSTVKWSVRTAGSLYVSSGIYHHIAGLLIAGRILRTVKEKETIRVYPNAFQILYLHIAVGCKPPEGRALQVSINEAHKDIVAAFVR